MSLQGWKWSCSPGVFVPLRQLHSKQNMIFIEKSTLQWCHTSIVIKAWHLFKLLRSNDDLPSFKENITYIEDHTIQWCPTSILMKIWHLFKILRSNNDLLALLGKHSIYIYWRFYDPMIPYLHSKEIPQLVCSIFNKNRRTIRDSWNHPLQGIRVPNEEFKPALVPGFACLPREMNRGVLMGQLVACVDKCNNLDRCRDTLRDRIREFFLCGYPSELIKSALYRLNTKFPHLYLLSLYD